MLRPEELAISRYLYIYISDIISQEKGEIKKKMYSLLTSLDSKKKKKKLIKSRETIAFPSNVDVTSCKISNNNLFLAIKIDHRSLNPGVARRFTRVSRNDKLSLRASFPSFAFPSDLEETILYMCVYVYRMR